ncbi:MAG TPA: DNA polymerase III subunit alpha [Candidatus Saccharimonadales bacterium]|nr:DNA polymerase III subunit alpha [Candidatus Saccharimonadales bacterium]
MGSKKQTLKPADYVHLHNHTQYSLLDGLTKVPALVDQVKKQGMEAVAVTDHGTLSGTIEFYKAAKSAGINPVIGMEAYVAARGLEERDPAKDKNNYHLILLAMNNTGYRNLMALSTTANLKGFYYRPRIDRELLEEHNEGLICLSGCASSEVGDQLRQGQYEGAKKIAQWYKKVFGDRYYLEIQDHGHPKHPSRWDEQVTINEQLFRLSEDLNIPCVVTCDAHYLKHEDQEAHEILLCVQTGSFLTDEKRMSLKDFELHVTDPKEVIGRWGADRPELITNSRAIAERCDVNIELDKILIPKFPVPKGETEKSYLHKLAWQGLAWRYGGADSKKSSQLTETAAKKLLTKEIIERAEYELGIMDSMGFNGYFLIVQDFIKWGKNQGIIFGPGRGSAAGSIVSYALRITEIEPLKYNLMFERFLNPGRISMPDIDIDIQDTRRDEVIQYCINKYGKDRVANIVTFGRMAARNAVRDVSRVLQVPYAEADRLAKMIPPPIQGRHIPLAKALKSDRDLKHEYSSNPTAKQVFDLAMQLEGTIRSHGVHAAGVVIAPEDIVNYTPLEMAQKGVIATQYSMGPIEELGLLKMDFLGLSNLTILNNALRIIRRVHGKKIELGEIPNDDEKTFELLQRGDTTGVFQFESSGMKRYLKELKPTVFEDVATMGALYRPGPMVQIPNFIQGKNNPGHVKYLHKSLEPVLSETYGAMVYQEQIIKLLQMVAGYSAGEADLVRKAIGKKKRDIMKAEEPKFINGCLKQGLTKAQAEKLWGQIQPFADYSFNKAHATCYGQISYWTAYLKAHYPAEFMAALMTSDYDDTDRLAIEITECKHMGITVLPPDVNESFVEFAVVPNKQEIRFGLAAIKNVGTGAVEEILRARHEGSFKDLEDFLRRVNSTVVNRKAMESLIKAGAFDRFEERGVLLHNLERIMAFTSRLQKQASSGQTDLFGSLGDDASAQSEHRQQLELQTPPTELDGHQQLQWERELLGLYLSRHPLETFEAFLAEQTVPLNSLEAGHEGQMVTIGGIVTSVRDITTKNGRRMAFIKLEDHFGELEIILFPGGYEQHAALLQQDKIVLIRGKVNSRDKDGRVSGEIKVNVEKAKEITAEDAAAYQPTGDKKQLNEPVTAVPVSERVYIRMASTQDEDKLLSLKKTIDTHKGETEVVLVLGAESSKQAIKLPGGISRSGKGLDQLKELVGTDNLVIR